ncbi:hypothetical protein DIPPA_32220 [Diplonema papillatum]|nr:hypothetical protein DIPPA_32220 [Diplonema papillatum]
MLTTSAKKEKKEKKDKKSAKKDGGGQALERVEKKVKKSSKSPAGKPVKAIVKKEPRPPKTTPTPLPAAQADEPPPAAAAPAKKATWTDLETWGLRATTNLATRRVLAVQRQQEAFGRDRRSLDEMYDPDSAHPVAKLTKADLFAEDGLLPVRTTPSSVYERRQICIRSSPAEYWKKLLVPLDDVASRPPSRMSKEMSRSLAKERRRVLG